MKILMRIQKDFGLIVCCCYFTFMLLSVTSSIPRVRCKGQSISEWIYEIYRFSQNMNKKLSRFLPSLYKAEILTIFCSYFVRNEDFINKFWDYLTFSCIPPSLLFRYVFFGGIPSQYYYILLITQAPLMLHFLCDLQFDSLGFFPCYFMFHC